MPLAEPGMYKALTLYIGFITSISHLTITTGRRGYIDGQKPSAQPKKAVSIGYADGCRRARTIAVSIAESRRSRILARPTAAVGVVKAVGVGNF
jgi:hypothetical protein